MLPLDSPRWAELRHHYGSAANLPELLQQLQAHPPQTGFDSSCYDRLFNSVCHHRDSIDTASYAVVPHILNLLSLEPQAAPWGFFLLPVYIEMARASGRGPEIPPDLSEAYFAALADIPRLAAEAAQREWDEPYCRAVAAALAVSKGQVALAQAILQLDPETVSEFLSGLGSSR